MYETRQTVPYVSLSSILSECYRGFDNNHNSALFAPDTADQASFSDEALMPLIATLYEACYRSRR
jgi:hypothetical protein